MTDEERGKIEHLLPILKQMQDIHGVLVDMSSKLEGVCILAKAHEKDLNGNGQPGLKTRLDTVQVTQETCPARERSRPANMIAYMALGLSALALIGSAVAKFLQ